MSGRAKWERERGGAGEGENKSAIEFATTVWKKTKERILKKYKKINIPLEDQRSIEEHQDQQ